MPGFFYGLRGQGEKEKRRLREAWLEGNIFLRSFKRVVAGSAFAKVQAWANPCSGLVQPLGPVGWNEA